MHVCHAFAIFVPFVLACSLNDDYFEPKLLDPKWLGMAISWGYLVGCKLGWNGGDNLQWLLYLGHQPVHSVLRIIAADTLSFTAIRSVKHVVYCQ